MDTSDYIEKCDKSHELRVTLEMASSKIIGTDWSLFVDAALLSDAGKHRKYNFSSLRDYLRLLRNKWNHYGELPVHLQQKLSQFDNNNNVNIKSAEKFLYYFTQFTPELVMYCYKLIASHIKCNNDQRIKSLTHYYPQIPQYRIDTYSKQVRVNTFRSWYNKH